MLLYEGTVRDGDRTLRQVLVDHAEFGGGDSEIATYLGRMFVIPRVVAESTGCTGGA